MSNRFNPYQAWFGLSTATKPSYYELLGVRNFESEPPVIAEAAECRLQLLAPHKTGPNAEFAAKLEREVTGVMNVLLSPDKRKQYDEKLRKERGLGVRTPSPASADDMLPPALEAADSPTTMLPPGALHLPPAMPPADPQSGYAGYGPPADPGYPGYGAPVQPFATAAPYAGAQPFGVPQQPFTPGPQFAAAPAMPQATAQFGQPFATAPAMPGFPPSAAPAPFAATASSATPFGDPMATSAAPFTSSNAAQRTRLTGARRQKSSNMMIALGLLGGGAAVLGIIMLVVAAGDKTKAPAAAPKPVAVRPPNKMNSEDLMRIQAEQAIRNGTFPTAPSPPTSDTFGRPNVYRSATQAELMAESVVPNAPSMPSMPDLVQSMAPAGAVPSIATPKPSGTVPSFDMPTPTPSATAAMPSGTVPSTPTTPAAVPSISITGMDGAKPAMEASLPADAARARSVQTMLGQARKFMKSREYAKAEEIIIQAEVLADVPELISTAQEHNRLSELLRTFWLSAREGVKSLKEEEELTYDGKTVKVVKHDELNLIVKGSDNKDTVLIIDKLLPGLAVMMAERTLPKDDVTTKLALAAFFGLDQGGDRAKATALLEEAKSLGAEVDALRAVIESGT